ncbi:hypothetical protein [Kitasatospora sp. NPDC091207]|uniref:hypothetical protein n=1 Tax=Kitasatospora sp. NPDC091207 TaxID=3364083 RepID=UPI0038040853
MAQRGEPGFAPITEADQNGARQRAAAAPNAAGTADDPAILDTTPHTAATLDTTTLNAAREYGRLLQAYERLFWETLATPPAS